MFNRLANRCRKSAVRLYAARSGDVLRDVCRWIFRDLAGLGCCLRIKEVARINLNEPTAIRRGGGFLHVRRQNFKESKMDASAVTAITSAISFTTVVAGIGAVGAAVVLLKVARRGMKALVGAI